MGGCCCSSRKPPQLHGTPVFYYFPPASEEYESLTSDDSAATALTSGFLDDLNLDRSTPDTYRSPPAPIPFEVVLGHPQSGGPEFTGEPVLHHSYERTTFKDIKQSDRKTESEFLLASLKKAGIGLVNSNLPIIQSAEEEDVCPTCLEEYDADNPKIVAKCKHHFHLSCILEWMERSQTCPICDQVLCVPFLFPPPVFYLPRFRHHFSRKHMRKGLNGMEGSLDSFYCSPLSFDNEPTFNLPLIPFNVFIFKFGLRDPYNEHEFLDAGNDI